METKENFIDKLFDKGILVNKELIEQGLEEDLINLIKGEEDLIVLNSDYAEIISKDNFLIDWYEIDKYRVDFEKEKDQDLYQTQLQDLRHNPIQSAVTLGRAS